jgi:Protein of unknown function (DUF3339)
MQVLLATILFILLSPGLIFTFPYGEEKGPFVGETTSNLAVLVHGVLFFVANKLISAGTWPFNYVNDAVAQISTNVHDVPPILATIAFIVLSPGLIATIPAFDGEMFFSQETNTLAILVHAVLFYVLLRLYADNSTNDIVQTINNQLNQV